jgi:diguanylate cyclase (GGDEF)-like protein
MASRRNALSLRSFSLSSGAWFFGVIAGWSLIAYSCARVIHTTHVDLAPQLAMTAFLLLGLELLPLVQGRGHDPEGVVMSTAFVCGLLFLWGPWPAILMLAVASMVADVRSATQWWKTIFNAGQYSLSVFAGYLVMLLAGRTPSLSHPLHHFQIADMLWVMGVWAVYFMVNLTLVAAAVSYRAPFRTLIVDDLPHYSAMTFSVLALSPLVSLVALSAWELLPLLLIPLLLLHHTAQMYLEREHAAAHDPLTGLPNRTTLTFALNTAFADFVHHGRPFGLMLLDLDDFKRVNDTLGHQVGDLLLVQFAERLRTSVRTADHVARLGGDEFAVLVFDADQDEVLQVAARLREALVDPIEVESVHLEIEVSMGVATCPDHATDGDALLRRADVAMYSAKTGHNGIQVYSPARDDNSADRLTLLGELREALAGDDLELHYQPKLSTRDGSTLGVEALVRWEHPRRGKVPPDLFIPLAERSGIMPMLTERVLTLAMAQIAAWRDADLWIPVAVNVSPSDLIGGRLIDIIVAGLHRHALPAGMLQLEITERMATQQLEEANNTLDRLRELGVTISLDDFGTGYSSLLRLHALPVDEIKIDRVFVSAMSEGPESVGIVKALIDLAHAFGLPAIAEGVETQEEWQQLDQLGCDGVQGWHVAMPMPHAQATAWVRNRTAVDQLPVRPQPYRDQRVPTGTSAREQVI